MSTLVSDIQTTAVPLKKTRSGRYQLNQKDVSSWLVLAVGITFLFALIFFLGFAANYKWDQFSPAIAAKIAIEFFRFDKIALTDQLSILSLLINTVILGFITTVLGALIGLPFGLLAARNLSWPWLSNIIKALASFVRAVPTIIWVLLFISGYGLTSTTAIVGMVFHSWAFFVKSYSESFEEVDSGTIEALRSTGCTPLQVISSAVIPSAATRMISWIAMRSEINFAVAVVIGPAVGVAGTIGSVINGYSRVGNYSGLGFSLFCVFLTALIFELILTRLKQKAIS
ncbi:MAG: phosphonate ABC transporter permease [Limosilactobacillus fermentum]|nr:MAG: phosphonate ABC transporter permease [Limosilactobacillus fermentum]